MKTTVEIDDELYRAAKKRAVDEGITFRSLLDGALREKLGPGTRRKNRRAPGKAGQQPTIYDPEFYDYWRDRYVAAGGKLESIDHSNPRWRAELYDERTERIEESIQHARSKFARKR